MGIESGIDVEEGRFLYDIIANDTSVKQTLEVGCALGLSALHICEALKGREGCLHQMVDPYQKTEWMNIGLKNLQESGVEYYHLIENKSELALPALLSEKENTLDFVLVDGWHTFDHTLIDCFYATRLLKVGGYLVVDDVHFPAIRQVVDYLLNYPCYEFFDAVSSVRPVSWFARLKQLVLLIIPGKIKSKVISKRFQRNSNSHVQRMVALKKIASDDRKWDWHNENF